MGILISKGGWFRVSSRSDGSGEGSSCRGVCSERHRCTECRISPWPIEVVLIPRDPFGFSLVCFSWFVFTFRFCSSSWASSNFIWGHDFVVDFFFFFLRSTRVCGNKKLSDKTDGIIEKLLGEISTATFDQTPFRKRILFLIRNGFQCKPATERKRSYTTSLQQQSHLRSIHTGKWESTARKRTSVEIKERAANGRGLREFVPFTRDCLLSRLSDHA